MGAGSAPLADQYNHLELYHNLKNLNLQPFSMYNSSGEGRLTARPKARMLLRGRTTKGSDRKAFSKARQPAWWFI
jgi:hypothetical protein